ncbi:conserved hypothetical protein [uncultured Dysgonomonas sp.]|uniref:Glycosyltransferase 2-like domain-containing protein n=1 Tax=uncultured Dysgonomonas sp. TaxID=206096 RepID=A0A212J6F1_9BACT|nr:glycosyltransferase [uncultured Dysgonomonas sp.]SBV95049.1 conserved hypothetical protein [uncultured Dysgonomonas sp.]
MNKPKVSIIIPVYNTESFVEEAIKSVLVQTLTEIEVIVVDDGSTDSSLEIIKTLADTDSRIKVFSQENQGQSVARNLGLSIAKGQYIYFMDSDDMISQNTLEICYNKCTSEDLDFVFFDAEIFSNGDIILPISYNRIGKTDTQINTGIQKINELIETRGYSASVCLLFIKHNYIASLSLNFLPGIAHEDQLFTAKLYSQAQRVAYIPEAFFHRRFRPDSIMTKQYTIFNVRNYFIVVDELIKFASSQNENIKKTINKTIRFFFDPAIYMSNIFRWHERFSIAKICFLRYRKYISVKSWLVLIFPWLIKLKSYIK